jgi:hypothetical protein
MARDCNKRGDRCLLVDISRTAALARDMHYSTCVSSSDMCGCPADHCHYHVLTAISLSAFTHARLRRRVTSCDKLSHVSDHVQDSDTIAMLSIWRASGQHLASI